MIWCRTTTTQIIRAKYWILDELQRRKNDKNCKIGEFFRFLAFSTNFKFLPWPYLLEKELETLQSVYLGHYHDNLRST